MRGSLTPRLRGVGREGGVEGGYGNPLHGRMRHARLCPPRTAQEIGIVSIESFGSFDGAVGHPNIDRGPPVNDGYRDLHGIGWSEPVEEPAARWAERAIPAVRRDQWEAAQRLVPDPIPDGKAHEASGSEVVFDR